MSYNSGIISLFKSSATATSIVADSLTPTFNFNKSVNGLIGSFIAPTVQSTSAVNTFYEEFVAPRINQTSGIATVAYSVYLSGPQVGSGLVQKGYSLYVNPSTGSGTIVNNFTAYFQTNLSIGTTASANALNVSGSMAVGTYAGSIQAPLSGMIISGSLGVGTSSPSYSVDVFGSVSGTQVYSGVATRSAQLGMIAEGWVQGTLGGGAPGSQRVMSAQTALTVNLTPYGANAMVGGVYDGRYIYFAPTMAGGGGAWGPNPVIVRYDTTLPFSLTTSYSFYNSLNAHSFFGGGFSGAVFDGRYIYYVPYVSFPTSNASTVSGGVMRYDTSLDFTSASSYKVFDTRAFVNSLAGGFWGAVFDGRYIYYVPFITFFNVGFANNGSAFVRYDTMSSFTASSSYQTFSTSSLSSICVGFKGGTFDGRYVYLITGTINAGGNYLGTFLQYDTTASFTGATSYSFLDLTTLYGAQAAGFQGCVFDGQYVYCLPQKNSIGPGALLVQYNTQLPFAQSASYNTYDISGLDASGLICAGGIFDGRYLFLIGTGYLPFVGAGGATIKYDTTLPFTQSASYSYYKIDPTNGLNNFGAVTDGRYVYTTTATLFNPTSRPDTFGYISRLDAYQGPQLVSLNATSAPQGLILQNGGNIFFSSMSTATNAGSGTTGTSVPNQVFTYLSVSINGSFQKIPVFQN